MTDEELKLLGIRDPAHVPTGGQELRLQVRSGSGTADRWTKVFGPCIHAKFGVHLYPGSLNLWCDEQVIWEAPLRIDLPQEHFGIPFGEFCPIVLEENAIGLTFRGNCATPNYLEVLSPVELRRHLNDVADGTTVNVRLLSGRLLRSSA